MKTTAGGHAPIDDTLRWVVVGFRLVTVAWMGALVGATLATDTGARAVVVGATYGVALAWTGLTVAHAMNPRWFRTVAWAVLDGLVALGVSISPFLAESHDLYFGGYPLSWLVLLAYVGGIWPALAGAAVLATGQVVGAMNEVGRTATHVAGDIGVFTVTAILSAWTMTLLRRYDLARAQAQEALEVERAARQRAHDRAEIAAHLHDSVLQTLALIQQGPDDPRRVAALARGQERELRRYLDQIASPHNRSLRAALRQVAGEVEDLFMTRVDTVVVGDCEVEDRFEGLIQGTREALVNAARHSGADTVSLFAEVGPAEVAVTVRDRGRGFDPDHPGAGRGIAESIVGRMGRFGGTARIRSAPGEGTEVDLRMGRDHG